MRSKCDEQHPHVHHFVPAFGRMDSPSCFSSRCNSFFCAHIPFGQFSSHSRSILMHLSSLFLQIFSAYLFLMYYYRHIFFGAYYLCRSHWFSPCLFYATTTGFVSSVSVPYHWLWVVFHFILRRLSWLRSTPVTCDIPCSSSGSFLPGFARKSWSERRSVTPYHGTL